MSGSKLVRLARHELVQRDGHARDANPQELGGPQEAVDTKGREHAVRCLRRGSHAWRGVGHQAGCGRLCNLPRQQHLRQLLSIRALVHEDVENASVKGPAGKTSHLAEGARHDLVDVSV